jgi:predicted negative regulator of RcsB-dependent stress response
MKMTKDKKKKAIDAEINRALLDDFDKFNALIHRRWKDMIYYSIAIVVIVAVIATVVSIRNKKLAKAENVFANALTEEALIKAIGEYGDYEAADFARLKLARIYIDKKEFAKAAAEYKKVFENTASIDLKERMQLDLAYLLEKEGKNADALAAFKVVGDAVNNSAAVRAEAYYAAGRLSLLEKDSANAKIYLEQVKSLAASIEGGNLYGELAIALLAEIQ